MTLARRGTRLIDIDGRRYRWRVHAAHDPTLAIVVELADGAAQRMVTWVHPPATIVTPGLVRSVVRHALASGWVPDRRGVPMTFPSFQTKNSQEN